MSIYKGSKLPDEHHITRWVPWSKIRKDDDGNSLGEALPEAFALRPADNGSLSVCYVEHYAGNLTNQLHESVKHFRKSFDDPPGAKSAFVIGNIGTVKNACQPHSSNVRIVFAPSGKNPAHSVIMDFKDDAILLDQLASEVFNQILYNKDVPP